MPKIVRPLTSREIETAKATDKPYKLYDGQGLFLTVTVKGSKLWRLKYRIHGKERTISIGSYPTVSLKDTRDIRDEYRKKSAKGIDPIEEKKNARLERERERKN